MSDDLAAVKRLHDAANDPTYTSPRVRRADIQAVVRLVDAQAARLEKRAALEAAARAYVEREVTGEPIREASSRWQALKAAVAALAAPPGESP